LTVALVGVGVACRLFRFWLNFPIWADEASLALNFAERDYRGLFRELNYQQVAPLLFLWIEKSVWQWAGPSEAFLRLLPLLAGIGGLVLFWRLARTLLSPMSAVLAVGVLAVSEWPIELCCSIKPYALDLFFGVLLQWLAIQALCQPGRTVWPAALALIVPFAVFLSYPVVFVAGAVSLVLAPKMMSRTALQSLLDGSGERSYGGFKAARSWFIAFNVLLVSAFLAQLLFVGREKDPANPPDLDGYMQSFWHHGFPHGGLLKSMWWVVRIHVGKIFSYPVGFNGGGLIGLAAVLLGVRALWRQRQRNLVLLCLLPFALHLMAACLRRYPYGMHPRIEQDLAPGLCVLAGSGLAAVIERLAVTSGQQACLLAAGVSGLVLIGLGMSVAAWRYPYHDEVALWARSIVQHLQREMQPGDRLLVSAPAKSSHVCLRWQLLALADRTDEPEAYTLVGALQGANRVWIVDARGDEEPLDAPEPVPILPYASLDALGWQAVNYQRFRACADSEAARLYRLFGDVYFCRRGQNRVPISYQLPLSAAHPPPSSLP
jgi:hypothetical protein